MNVAMPYKNRVPLTTALSYDADMRLSFLQEKTGLPRSRILDHAILLLEEDAVLRAAEDPTYWTIEIEGEVKTARQWAIERGIPPSTVRYRLRAGYNALEALEQDKWVRNRGTNFKGSNHDKR